jgi:hypothetical protein
MQCYRDVKRLLRYYQSVFNVDDDELEHLWLKIDVDNNHH